jgi:negative regulator of flagellin synthesis FlgM
MKINDSNKKTAGLGAAPGYSRAGKPTEKAETLAAGTDSVRISTQSQALASQALSGGAVFDAAKVEEIKAAIANGSFKIKPERIADRLIDTVKDLIKTPKS